MEKEPAPESLDLHVRLRSSNLCIFSRFQMSRFYFAPFVCLFFLVSGLHARQYNLDYLMQIIEEENSEAIHGFFAQQNYVTKVKHLIEFGELFRTKLEEHFGYKPSWQEAYDFFKANQPNMDFPKEKKKEFLNLFKAITQFCENSETHLVASSFNYRGSPDPEIDLPPELTIAFIEGVGGALLCIIPGGIPQVIGRSMIADATRRTFDYCQRKDEPHQIDAEPSSDYSDHSCEPSRDHDRWDNDYPDRGEWW